MLRNFACFFFCVLIFKKINVFQKFFANCLQMLYLQMTKVFKVPQTGRAYFVFMGSKVRISEYPHYIFLLMLKPFFAKPDKIFLLCL